MGHKTFTIGDRVADRIKQRTKLAGGHVGVALKQYVHERTAYRLDRHLGQNCMFKGSFAAWIQDPENARPAPDVDLHLAEPLEDGDLDLVLPELLVAPCYDAGSPTGLMEDGLSYANIRVQPSSRGGVKLLADAMLGQTRVPLSVDVNFGHGCAYDVRTVPHMFASLPRATVLTQPAECRHADKIVAAYEFSTASTRLKDIHDLERAASGPQGLDATTTGKALAAACAARGLSIESLPGNLSDAYAEANEAAWTKWKAKAAVTDPRTLLEVVRSVRGAVAAAVREARRELEDAAGRAAPAPRLRLVA